MKSVSRCVRYTYRRELIAAKSANALLSSSESELTADVSDASDDMIASVALLLMYASSDCKACWLSDTRGMAD